MSHKRFMVFTQPAHDRDINDFGCLRFDTDDLDSAKNVARKCMARNECTSIYDRGRGTFVALV